MNVAKIDLETRRNLGRNNTAKALHAYYSTHINPVNSIDVDRLG